MLIRFAIEDIKAVVFGLTGIMRVAIFLINKVAVLKLSQLSAVRGFFKVLCD